jgi:hypothetical protein
MRSCREVIAGHATWAHPHRPWTFDEAIAALRRGRAIRPRANDNARRNLDH